MTEQEANNVRIVKEYLEISYDPNRATAQNVAHIVGPGNRFIAPTTFPEVHNCETYTEEHGKLMKSINNLHIIAFDYILAKDNQVALRYSAEGSHDGEPYKGIKPTGKKAEWTAAGLFKLENGKITLLILPFQEEIQWLFAYGHREILVFRFIKEWDKLSMWKQLGFPLEEETTTKTDTAAPLPLMSTTLLAIRHQLHAQPELSGEEKHTAARIVDWLQEAGAGRIITGLGGHGVIGVFSGREAGPRVMLRAELDALPISERGEGREWCSRNEHVAQGVVRKEHITYSHVCGHDGHMTMLLGVAKQLAHTPPTRGEVLLLFQPAEETGAGARAVIETDKFDASVRPDVAYALHNQPGRPFGEVSIREEAFACASRGMIVRLHGHCSHAAYPEQGRSPVRAMYHLLEELEQLPKRLPATEELRLVTTIHACLGEVAFGTTPGEAVVMVTLRTATDALMLPLVDAARELVEREAREEQLTYDIEFRDEFAGMLNDRQATADVIHCAQKLGKMLTLLQAPNRWCEDFGVFSAVCRCAMFLLGAGDSTPGLHNAAYDFPDALIEHGVEMFWALLHKQRLFDD